jgi:hypothetical protein
MGCGQGGLGAIIDVRFQAGFSPSYGVRIAASGLLKAGVFLKDSHLGAVRPQ